MSWWQGKRSWYSRRIRNPKFYVSRKRPGQVYSRYSADWKTGMFLQTFFGYCWFGAIIYDLWSRSTSMNKIWLTTDNLYSSITYDNNLALVRSEILIMSDRFSHPDKKSCVTRMTDQVDFYSYKKVDCKLVFIKFWNAGIWLLDYLLIMKYVYLVYLTIASIKDLSFLTRRRFNTLAHGILW